MAAVYTAMWKALLISWEIWSFLFTAKHPVANLFMGHSLLQNQFKSAVQSDKTVEVKTYFRYSPTTECNMLQRPNNNTLSVT